MSNNLSIKVVYEVRSKEIKEAAHCIAIGQSIGNPKIRTPFDIKIIYHIPYYEISGNLITVWFPLINMPEQMHVNYLMSVLMGGQMDIDVIESCRLVDIDLSLIEDSFIKPRYGVKGIRNMVGAPSRPLIGSVIKPKIGLTVKQMVEVCKKLADGGVDFIKEDEILSFHSFAPFEERTEAIVKALQSYPTIYAPCCTSDDFRFPKAHVKCIHVNIWCGFGYFNIMRRHVPYEPALFFQKSGDKVWTTGPYSVDYSVICKIVNMIGCDFAHVGMYGGYMSESENDIKKRINALGNTIPSFSCGSTPRHVELLTKKFGRDIMITSGGYINGHPKGITYAAKEFRNEAEKVR